MELFSSFLTYIFYAILLLGLGMTILVSFSFFSKRRIRRGGVLYLVIKRDFVVRNADTGGEAIIFAGTHKVERIPNPCSPNGISWLVARGTKIGMPEDYWRRWEGSHWAHFQVEIREIP